MQTATQPTVKANELRIGNIIKHPESGYFSKIITIDRILGVVHLFQGGLLTFQFPVEDFQPVELSPEILEKCGFEKKQLGIVYQYSKRERNAWFSILWDDKLSHFVFDSPHYGIFYKYLHQLQNLYFALTNSELEINL